MWKQYCKVLGKAPVFAAMLPCIQEDPHWEAGSAIAARDELVGHYKAKLLNKAHKELIKHELIRECVQSRWSLDSVVWLWKPSSQGITLGTINLFIERVRGFVWIIRGCQNYWAEGASILRSQHLIHKDNVKDIENKIKQSCIDWALE